METIRGYSVEDFLEMGIIDFFSLGFTKEELEKAMKMIDEHEEKYQQFDNADNL